jgi:hypothetical protein
LPFSQSHRRLHSQKFSTGTLGEKKANVKRLFLFVFDFTRRFLILAFLITGCVL